MLVGVFFYFPLAEDLDVLVWYRYESSVSGHVSSNNTCRGRNPVAKTKTLKIQAFAGFGIKTCFDVRG